MLVRSILAGAALMLGTLTGPAVADAHSRIVASTPAQGATVAGTRNASGRAELAPVLGSQ